MGWLWAGLEVCYLFLYFGLTSGRSVVIDAYEESGCGMAGARTLLARALCAALGHSRVTVASQTLLDAVALTEPVKLGRATLHLHHRDILTGPPPSAVDLVWSTVTTPFHLFHFLLGAAGGAFLLTYQDSWDTFRHRAPYTVHVFRREGAISNEKQFSLIDLTSYPSFVQPYHGLKPFESPAAVKSLASYVPPGWLSLKAGLDRVLQEWGAPSALGCGWPRSTRTTRNGTSDISQFSIARPGCRWPSDTTLETLSIRTSGC